MNCRNEQDRRRQNNAIRNKEHSNISASPEKPKNGNLSHVLANNQRGRITKPRPCGDIWISPFTYEKLLRKHISVLHQLDQKIIYPHYDFKHLTEKYFEIGMKLDDFRIQLVKYCIWYDEPKTYCKT